MNWQPIETAPKRMENVLVSDGDYVYLGWLNNDGYHEVGAAEHQDDPLDPQPTHWMPLPAPPLSPEPHPLPR